MYINYRINGENIFWYNSLNVFLCFWVSHSISTTDVTIIVIVTNIVIIASGFFSSCKQKDREQMYQTPSRSYNSIPRIWSRIEYKPFNWKYVWIRGGCTCRKWIHCDVIFYYTPFHYSILLIVYKDCIRSKSCFNRVIFYVVKMASRFQVMLKGMKTEVVFCKYTQEQKRMWIFHVQ